MPTSAATLYTRLLARARLRHLHLLVSVADHGSLKRAAEHVGMSQPAATQAIGELERLLGAPLFERRARGMSVSDAGRVVMPVARQVLHALRESMESLSVVQGSASGLLRIGMIPAAGLSLAESLLPGFSRRHPGLQIVVVEGTPRHLLEELAAGGLNVVLLRRPAELPARLRFQPMAADEAVVVAGVKHPLAGRAQVSIEDLAAWPWLRAPDSVPVREVFDRLFEAGLPALHRVSTSSVSVIFALLRDHETLTLAPTSVADWYVGQGLVVRLAWPARLPLPGIGAAYAADAQHEPGVAAFLEALRAIGPRP